MTLSTHVLDATTGRPAAGVQVRLDGAASEGGAEAGWAPAGAGQTDADGRLRLVAPGGADFDPGVYRITFGTGAYFTARGATSFYPEVTITFEMTERGEHYHVPLLLSPYAYSTYRGKLIGREPVVIENCAIATMDGPRHDQAGTEYRSGHVTVTGDRITAVGEGPAPDVPDGARRIDGAGCLTTPGLVNTHHHLYQWLTQGRAQQSVLFDWLTELYPVWARIDAGQVHAAATAGLAWLALSGCTTSTDHHYIFPRVPRGDADALAAEVAAAARVGLRFHPCRGSMDLGRSAGGLPPDEIVEDTDTALAATEQAVRRFHDPSPGAMVRVAAGPCSPFSVTPRLMRESAELARGLGVRMHTHLAESREEDEYCRQALGRTPAEYAEDLGWLGPDVWLAHCVQLDEAAVRRFAATGTSVAHCPTSNARLGAGIAPVRDLLQAGATVGLGVDGAASSEGTSLVSELRQALLVARVREGPGPSALTARQALWLGTRGGARCLGRDDETGALRPGLLADIALWRLDTLAHDAIGHGPGDGDWSGDPVAALVLGPPAPLELLLVGGTPVVEGGELRTADPAEAAREVRAARRRLADLR